MALMGLTIRLTTAEDSTADRIITHSSTITTGVASPINTVSTVYWVWDTRSTLPSSSRSA